MRKVRSATIHCLVTLRQAQNPGLSASKSGEEVKSKWIGVTEKKTDRACLSLDARKFSESKNILAKKNQDNTELSK